MIKIFNHYISKAQSIPLLVEVIILVSSVYLGATIRFVDSRYIGLFKVRKLLYFGMRFCFDDGAGAKQSSHLRGA